MSIPLGKRMKKRLHLEIGTLQDEVVDLLYTMQNSLVLHGGTAVWRCYGGNRFSEDLDFYAPKAIQEKEFVDLMERRGLKVLKFKRTGSLVFSKISDGNVEIRLEINFSAQKKGVVRSYERMDGSSMGVFSLDAEELMLEKANAYSNRRFIRDIYDVFHLSAAVKPPPKTAEAMRRFLKSLPQPADEKNLGAIVYSGAVPAFSQMVEILKSRFSA